MTDPQKDPETVRYVFRFVLGEFAARLMIAVYLSDPERRVRAGFGEPTK